MIILSSPSHHPSSRTRAAGQVLQNKPKTETGSSQGDLKFHTRLTIKSLAINMFLILAHFETKVDPTSVFFDKAYVEPGVAHMDPAVKLAAEYDTTISARGSIH